MGSIEGHALIEEDGRGARWLLNRSPRDGALVERLPLPGESEVRACVDAARRAQVAWGEMPVGDRAQVLAELGRILAKHAELLVQSLVDECGKPPFEALVHEVMVAADFAHYLAKEAPRILAPQTRALRRMPQRKSLISYHPRGVVGVISPWNYPLATGLSEVFSALVAGNAVVLKPSESASSTLLRARELFAASALDPALFQIVLGDGATGNALIDARPDLVVFTGGTETGRKVAAECGARLIPCILELGGKAAGIVASDADIEVAAKRLVWGGFANSGQICVGVERIFAPAAIYPALVSALTKETLALRLGDPSDPSVDVACLTTARQAPRLQALVDDAVARGARLVRPTGAEVDPKANRFPPSLLLDCTPEMRIMREESFGPLLPVMSVRDEEEALSHVNALPQGLAGYVFGKDRARALAIARRMRAGVVVVNDVLLAYGLPEAPFGGIGESGFGRVHGEEGLREMCVVRHVNVERLSLKASPFAFPYGAKKYRFALRALKWLLGS